MSLPRACEVVKSVGRGRAARKVLDGVDLERFALGPGMARIAVGYASLELAADPAQIAAVLVGLVALATAAVLWVARQAAREPIVAALSGSR